MRSTFVLLALAVVLSGCVGEDADTGDPDALPDIDPELPDPADVTRFDFDAGIAVPKWEVGDWWAYTVTYDSGETYDAKIIVHGEDGSHYHITADDRDLVVRASFNHYPNFEPVAKSDLSQSIHGDTVSSLRFPMKNGTWSGTYRDFPATWETEHTLLTTPKGQMPGFMTTMRNADDGLARITHGWSPVVKWFTEFHFDFDGTGTADVTYTLRDWGSGHTGTFPVVEVVDGVHRMFPTVVVPHPDPANPPQPPGAGPEATDTMDLQQENASLLWGMFAGAGGAGDFEFELGHAESQARHSFPWRPTAAGARFTWGELTDQPTGEWGITGFGAAQGFAFLFIEVYEVRTTEGRL